MKNETICRPHVYCEKVRRVAGFAFLSDFLRNFRRLEVHAPRVLQTGKAQKKNKSKRSACTHKNRYQYTHACKLKLHIRDGWEATQNIVVSEGLIHPARGTDDGGRLTDGVGKEKPSSGNPARERKRGSQPATTTRESITYIANSLKGRTAIGVPQSMMMNHPLKATGREKSYKCTFRVHQGANLDAENGSTSNVVGWSIDRVHSQSYGGHNRGDDAPTSNA